MAELIRVLNRLRSRGMKGWHSTKEDWVQEVCAGMDLEAIARYATYFIDHDLIDRRMFTLEVVLKVSIKLASIEREHFEKIYNEVINL